MKWTPEKLELLRTLYPCTPNSVLGARLGCAPRNVGQRARKMGLRKCEAFMRSELSGRRQPGQESWNKGLKGSTGLHPNTRRNQFKPGRPKHEARNYRPIGSHRISKDGYLERKVTDDHPVPARRWVAVHRLAWEAAHGPIPEGHAVVFLAGQRTDVEAEITPDKLELVDRTELMRRNSRHRLPKEVADLIALRGAITRQINRREKRGRIPDARTSP